MVENERADDGASQGSGIAYYRMDERLGNGRSLTLYVTVPEAMTDFEIQTARVDREGGTTSADRKFRRELFEIVGSITVAGGQIEAALKRILLLLKGESTLFSLADYEWSNLHKRILAACVSDSPREVGAKRALKWADSKDLRERRHTAVHGAWWMFADCGARVSRWPRKKGGHVIISELEDWRKLSDDLWEFYEMLDAVISEDWPRAILPS
ncbi:hypothetical protein [Prauserella endophytica]|uniref:Apea-like HEPN domain-containing protein n=1 Tax=Prauserella endophytica TaxID=1592324 RepID=A0ABY2RRV0_9PSEU|nr:hypothetical protein [Prauserella endophytica]TKG57351.1 hypothetical protein FCN18_38925 [Prauserella endophytica]